MGVGAHPPVVAVAHDLTHALDDALPHLAALLIGHAGDRFTDGQEAAWLEHVIAVERHDMDDVVIDLFVNSNSFANAKDRIGYVERLKTWDKSYSGRLIKAVKTNNQISGSWGVPAQVEELVV